MRIHFQKISAINVKNARYWNKIIDNDFTLSDTEDDNCKDIIF